MISADSFLSKHKTHLVNLALIVSLGFIIYMNSLGGSFLWDDRFLVQENLLIRSWKNILTIFSSPLTPGFSDFYRPLVNISFLCDYSWSGLDPRGYHLTNVILHLLTACLVYFLFFLLSKDKMISLASGLIFSAHAIFTEPVNYISSRADLLGALFFILAFIFYVKYVSSDTFDKLHYFIALLSFALSLLAKEMGLMLPFLLVAYGLMFKTKKKALTLLIPFFAITILYGALRLTILRFPTTRLFIPQNTIADIPFIQRFFTGISAIPVMIRLMLFPLGLHKCWLIKPIETVFEPRVIFAVILIVSIAVLGKMIYNHSRTAAFGIWWFFIMLAPHANIYPLNAFLNEGWLYLPSVGFILFLSSSLVYFIHSRKMFVFLLIFILCYYSLLTIYRNRIWSGNPTIFYKDTLKYDPYEDRIYNVLGNAYYSEGRLDEALSEYRKSLALNPKNPATHYNIGTAYYKQNKLGLAIEELKKAIEFAPNYTEAHNNLGLAYHRQNNLLKAQEEFGKAVEFSPNYAEAHYNLGNAYFQNNKLDNAIVQYQKAIALQPNDAQIYHNLGNAYIRQKMFDAAIDAFQKSIRINPKRAQTHNDLGSVYFEQNKLDRATAEYEKTLSLDPGYAQAYYNLGVIYYKLGQYEKSKNNLKTAASLFAKQNNDTMLNQTQELIERMP